jgi:hypothetical protein
MIEEMCAEDEAACPGCGDTSGECGCIAAAEEMAFFDEAEHIRASEEKGGAS